MSDSTLRVVSGHPWTVDSRWVVVGQMVDGGPEGIVFDPGNGPYSTDPDDCTNAWMDLHDCLSFVRSQEAQR